MITDQSSAMTPSTQRPIPLSMRPDLVVKRIDYLGVGYWVVKDPAGLKYYRLQQEQYELLCLLNGERHLEALRDEMLRIMPTVRLQLSDVQHLITDLHEKGLVYSNREGQGPALIKKHRDERRKRFFNTLRSLLYLRLPGWDPERTLAWLYPICRPIFFSRFGVALWFAIVLSAYSLLAIQFDRFSQELPTFQSFFGWPNVLYLWAVLGIAKIIHEFGHGLSCKHFGGECHEMGVMLLVFSPCLYCDVSDSWMLKNKWARIMIGAAGMYIEVLISAFAIFVWGMTGQGLLHNLALNTFFVTTVTTVIFNANPLMRFDGYYMMSDLLEIPNLRPKADRLLREYFAWYCLGIESKPDPFMPETGRVWFITFAIAAGIYRWFIVIAITVFLYTVLKPYGLQSIGATLAVISVGTILGNMIANVYKIIAAPRIEPMSKPKIAVTLTTVVALVVVALAIPLPWHLEASFIVEPLDVRHIYTIEGGELIDIRVQPGEEVKGPALDENGNLALDEEGNPVFEGDVLAVLSSVELEDKLAELESQLQVALKEIETQKKLGNTSQQTYVQSQAQAVANNIIKVRKQMKSLTLHAPVDGKVVAAPRVPEPTIETARKSLSTWNDTPLNKKNLGATIDPQTHMLSVAPNRNFQAIVLIDQGDRNDLQFEDLGEKLQDARLIELKFDHLAARTYTGKVSDVSRGALDYVPDLLSNKTGGDLPTVTDSQGREKLVSPVYQATVELSEDTQLLRSGMRGKARFLVEEHSTWRWIWRYINRTFYFKL